MTTTSYAIQHVNSDTNDMYCFVAKDEVEFDMWTDGLNVLLGNEVSIYGQNPVVNDQSLSMYCKLTFIQVRNLFW